jgi:hydroxymethylpyrimidine pyrophosphatase-like HAD family hydrolase
VRCLYVDLDGTLLGPGGSLLTGGDRGFSLEAVRALQACARAGVEVVIYSGRRQSSVFEAARLIGQGSYIFELGCGLVLDGELEWLTGGVEPSAQAGSIFEQISATGAPEMLLRAFDGRLEYHTPWSEGREVSHLFRGLVDLEEAAALLEEAGLGWLRLVDNGVIAAHGVVVEVGRVQQVGLGDERRSVGLDAGLERIHAYHLIPAAASKARAVARHMQNRGYAATDCIAAGDSREDMQAAEVVGTFWLVANALERDPTLLEEIEGQTGVRVASAGYGAGVYEAVVTTLAGA